MSAGDPSNFLMRCSFVLGSPGDRIKRIRESSLQGSSKNRQRVPDAPLRMVRKKKIGKKIHWKCLGQLDEATTLMDPSTAVSEMEPVDEYRSWIPERGFKKFCLTGIGKDSLHLGDLNDPSASERKKNPLTTIKDSLKNLKRASQTLQTEKIAFSE